MNKFDDIVENIETLMRFMQETETIRGYSVKSDFVFEVTKAGDCCFTCHHPTIDVKDEFGDVLEQKKTDYLTSGDLPAEQIATAIEEGSFKAAFLTAEEDRLGN